MYPAATQSLAGMFLVVAAFTVTTIDAMLVVVVLACRGLSFVRVGRLDRYAHALAGGSLALCGGGMVFLGL
jgi:threonine/homoserine/homoserine lactone efflux protein